MMASPWHTKSMSRMLITSKAAFLEKFLAVSTWILNGSLIECHKKKWLCAGAVENELSALVSFL